jgi:hypothetical protein
LKSHPQANFTAAIVPVEDEFAAQFCLHHHCVASLVGLSPTWPRMVAALTPLGLPRRVESALRRFSLTVHPQIERMSSLGGESAHL